MKEIVLSLVLLTFPPATENSPNPGFEREVFPVYAQVAEDAPPTDDTAIVECMSKGRERAAMKWGLRPGSTFSIMCYKDNGDLAAKEGVSAGGGHPALGFHKEDKDGGDGNE